ncbi:hypothetical protein CDO73_09645 [Saccharibacillus sp. O23]|uniref:hypothetical protein n=1 Tax=Saccharibacillus sp. O23 TaxID=2009338 RepID=UPI000B4E3A79|nr:hypothetical protein [Saccharibacillus sp. O23]OWR30841.1 hypothetical protein CDO73_09645 [Saccharibacillus sp. O23]
MESKSMQTDGAPNAADKKRISFRELAAYTGIGLITGTMLGLVLKMIQAMSGHRVYRLLLNADYVPLLGRFRLTETAEFVIHLLISAVLCALLGLIGRRIAKRRRLSASNAAAITAVVGLLIGALLYPTTLLSAGGTPPIDSLPAWTWWLAVHLLYGFVSGLLLYAALPRETKRF